MNTKYYLYKTSPQYPSDTCHTVMLAENESLDAILDGAMTDIFNELHDGDGENGGAGSLWRCAREIYDALKTGTHYAYADCEWWIEKIPREDVAKTWLFRFSAVLDASFTVTDNIYEQAKKKANEIASARAAELNDYIGKTGLLGWYYDGNFGDEGEEEVKTP